LKDLASQLVLLFPSSLSAYFLPPVMGFNFLTQV
jgi:hypothetical protein